MSECPVKGSHKSDGFKEAHAHQVSAQETVRDTCLLYMHALQSAQLASDVQLIDLPAATLKPIFILVISWWNTRRNCACQLR